MGWLNDLLKEYPALSVAKERLALIKESQFTEFKGVLWKKLGDYIDSLAYCPECKLAMSAFLPGDDDMLVCSKCNFMAPFKPSQVEAMVKQLETELLLL